MINQSVIATQIRVVRYRSTRIDHYYMPDGTIRRFVILEAHSLRDVLEKSRRTEIEKITERVEWDQVKRTAMGLLRELYDLMHKAREEKQTRKNQLPSPVLGDQLAPTVTNHECRGQLIFAGIRPEIPFCIELLDDTGTVRRIEGIDFARSLEVSGAVVGDYISVVRTGSNEVSIKEQCSGSHGSGKRNIKHSREVFQIIKENSIEQTSSDWESWERSGTQASA